MGTRFRVQNNDWDPMREDYENSSYTNQYADEDAGGEPELDHCRLYVRNIPPTMNEEGFRNIFSRFGTIVEIFVNAVPANKYGLVLYETPGEAKLAMMKLNKMEPLRLNINIAHKKKSTGNQYQKRGNSKQNDKQVAKERGHPRDSFNYSSRGHDDIARSIEDCVLHDDISEHLNDSYKEDSLLDLSQINDMYPDVNMELECLKLESLAVKEKQIEIKSRILKKLAAEGKSHLANGDSHGTRWAVTTNTVTANRSVKALPPTVSDQGTAVVAGSSSERDNVCVCKMKCSWGMQERSDGSSTASTCILCSDNRSGNKYTQDKSVASKFTDTQPKSDYTSKQSECTTKSNDIYYNFTETNMTDDTMGNTDVTVKNNRSKDEDETEKLIQLRSTDYSDVVSDDLKVVIAFHGYPETKMHLRHMALFQRSLSDVIDMQMKAGLLRKVPTFSDYYLSRGAIVCICKDIVTRNWILRISPGLEEKMSNTFVLLTTKVRKLCTALLEIPQNSWPSTAHDVFKLLQYFNPNLKTNLWRILSQTTRDNVMSTSFVVDHVSGEIIRGSSFKNVIDYNVMQFELTGYIEVYYERQLSDLMESVCSITSRVRLLQELKSGEPTPRNTSHSNMETTDVTEPVTPPQVTNADIDSTDDTYKLDDVIPHVESEDPNLVTTSSVMSENESMLTSNDTTLNGSNLTIDSNRGIAYHRRTNYLDVENELKVAITLDDYPQSKLEGIHIRRLKHLFKEYLNKDLKSLRFENMIVPTLIDVYLSNGAVIYICDSLETKDYLAEVLPKFNISTGLKLVFRDVKDLVRYTRVVMRLSKDNAHVESMEILKKLQSEYPNLKPDRWKYYSDVAGKQKRQFGVDPTSLDVIKSADFKPVYEGETLTFRIIDRQKREISFPESKDTDGQNDTTGLRDMVSKNMYVPIEPEIRKVPLNVLRTNHYSDLITDDLKLYIGPKKYPECRIDEPLFHSIKRAFENVLCESLKKGEITESNMPKFHDMYLFDGVIFVICQNMQSKQWIDRSLTTLNFTMDMQLKSTEYRGAVGIVNLSIETDKSPDEIITVLQKQNPRLRTKFWRKIKTERNKSRIDIVLQIDKLSAEVISGKSFNRYVGANAAQFKLGHLQSLIQPRLTKKSNTKKLKKTNANKHPVSMQVPKYISFDILKRELKLKYPRLKVDEWNIVVRNEKLYHNIYQLKIDGESAKIIADEGFKLTTKDKYIYFYNCLEGCNNRSESQNSSRNIESKDHIKMTLSIPSVLLLNDRDDLNTIFELLEDANPGINTKLWQSVSEEDCVKDTFELLVDKQSAAVIKSKRFDPNIAGETLKFHF